MDWEKHGIPKKYSLIDSKTMDLCKDEFIKIDDISDYNQLKVLHAFRECGIGSFHMQGSSGYGYDDIGRDTLDLVFSKIVRADDALCRTQFMSGTHAITVALFGILRSGMSILSVTGTPYDTLHTTLGIKNTKQGSLLEYGINYSQIELKDNRPDLGLIKEKASCVDVIYIQRSSGYSIRKAVSLTDIQDVSKVAKDINREVIIVVDNCYGEFTNTSEPIEYGADLIIGSLIKNPGGGIAETGGYIAGRKDLVELCGNRLTAPGVGREIGSNPFGYRNTYLGLYLAPMITGQALKSACYASVFFNLLGYETNPSLGENRNDIITSIKMDSSKKLNLLCKAIQSSSPIDSRATPQASFMPGYDNKVIMAAGAFTSGSSIELSSDAPLVAPYYAYVQGGLNLISSRFAFLNAAMLLDEESE